MRQHLHLPATALVLAALLLLPVGITGAMAEDEEIIVESDEDAIFDPTQVGGLDVLNLGDLVTDPGAVAPQPEETPEPTPEPTSTPKPTEKPEEKPPWITSVHYSKNKINFENEIWAILTGKWGLADFQAAGLMSSIQAESSFCPYNVQGIGGSDDRGAYLYDPMDSVGFGLCQWTSSGRKAALLRYANGRGSKDLVWDFDTQMAFMRMELDMNVLKATKTLYEAAEWTVMRFERPNQRYANSWPGTRYEKGRMIFRNHTGKDYVEPRLEFAVKYGDIDALASDGLVLDADAPGTLTVSGNYYWRLTQEDATVENWLEITCPSFYFPTTRTEACVCGYACDGEKALTLTVATPPEPGETYSTTLRFEIYRGQREVKTVKISVTGVAQDGEP